ncbi:hypothetical protein KSX_57030 [Ktedonospora formicarum]|uniref:HTH gntR-type domain-containing protein n=1 Tax=Ktedonospora formicarum TaxID=2778364 RepID=A0A8J3MWF8_9CHLR|nr:hypothetical protein KSX_57030 [Ktedonospora formicarum]
MKYAELRQLVEKLAGQRLPGERELAAQLGISRPALRSLLATLEAEGLVRRHQGSGTYANKLQAERLTTVALLIDEELKLGDDPFFSLLVERLQSHLQAEDIRCIIERIHHQRQPHNLGDGAITLGVAGSAVLAGLRPDDPPVVGLLLDARIPVHTRASLFQLADREAGMEAARHLLALQCQELVFVGRRDIASSQERLKGAEEIATQARISLQFVRSHLNYTAGLRLGRELNLSTIKGPIGLIATNDWLAVGLRAGLSSNTSVHDPIHIVSFDGLPMTSDPLLCIESLSVPIDVIAIDTITELRRLCQPAPLAGRIVRYPLYWS